MRSQAERNRMQIMGNAIGLPAREHELDVSPSAIPLRVVT